MMSQMQEAVQKLKALKSKRDGFTEQINGIAKDSEAVVKLQAGLIAVNMINAIPHEYISIKEKADYKDTKLITVSISFKVEEVKKIDKWIDTLKDLAELAVEARTYGVFGNDLRDIVHLPSLLTADPGPKGPSQ